MYKQLFFCGAIFLLSCEKDRLDESASAQIAVVHASTSMGEAELGFGGSNTLNLDFEQISGDPDNMYNTVGAGIQTFNLRNATGTFIENNLSYFTPGTKNSLFLYDTISPQLERKPALFKIVDPVRSSVDSGWVRFIHFATGIDSISAQLINDTDTLVVAVDWRQPALYSNSNVLATFRGPLKAGTYRLEFFDKNKDFFYGLSEVEITGGKSATIFSYGAYNPVAQEKMRCKQVFNN